MKETMFSDQLALFLLNRKAILDGICTWARSFRWKEPLDDYLWETLSKFAGNYYPNRSLSHIQSLFTEFRDRKNRQGIDADQRLNGRVLEISLQHLVNRHFTWRNSTPLIRFGQVLDVQEWLAVCNPDFFQCYLWAVDCETESSGDLFTPIGSRLRRLPQLLLKTLLHGPILPGVEEPSLQHLRKEGLAEIHRHLNGSTLPSIYWTYLLRTPHRLLPRPLAGEVDGLQERECIALLYTAKDLRAALLWRLLNNDQGISSQDWSKDVLDRLAFAYEQPTLANPDSQTFTISGTPDYRDPAALLPLGEDKPLIAERMFLYQAFELFHENTKDAALAAALHAYLLIQNLIWRALIQPRQKAKGFDRFARYHGLFLRIPEKEKRFYLSRLIQAERNSEIRWLELRVAPHNAWYEAYRLDQALRDIQGKKRPSDRLLELFNRSRPLDNNSTINTGLIFHFIKQAESPLKKIEIVPCRHSSLRQRVMKQARRIRQLHRSRRLGPYVIGIDAANSELNAGPEVFAPVIQWLKSRHTKPADPSYELLIRRFKLNEPKGLGLTYHVGEDFRHLLSGLRAVEEAIRFLKMGPGDRIGHGIALGLDYTKWSLCISGELAMPIGERLDDLVWFRWWLAQEPQQFGSLLFALDDEIQYLSRELYGHLDSTPDWKLLYEGWKLRDKDPLPYSNLDNQFQLITNVTEKISNTRVEVSRLWRAYHYDPTVRLKYNNYTRIQLYDPKQDWAKAVVWVQQQLLKIITDKRIAIEINPTSNLCIAPIERMSEHPVFRWYPPNDSAPASQPYPYVMVGSDDPGVFATELAFEYATLARAAEEHGATPRQIERWIQDLDNTSKSFCFLDTTQRKS